MKRVIRLSESELNRLVKEAVTSAMENIDDIEGAHKGMKMKLNEGYCWWGDTKPLEDIHNSAMQIVGEHRLDFDANEYDENDRAQFDLYNWAKRVAQEAEKFIHCEAHNISIDG